MFQLCEMPSSLRPFENGGGETGEVRSLISWLIGDDYHAQRAVVECRYMVGAEVGAVDGVVIRRSLLLTQKNGESLRAIRVSEMQVREVIQEADLALFEPKASRSESPEQAGWQSLLRRKLIDRSPCGLPISGLAVDDLRMVIAGGRGEDRRRGDRVHHAITGEPDH
jgi:hypothetical protein